MRKSYKYILMAAAFLSGHAAYGQGRETVLPKDHADGIVVSKTARDNHDGTFTLTLESFVTGYQSNTITHVIKEVAKPLDVVLVLDVSGSMDDDIVSYTYTPRSSQSYSYRDLQNKEYYYLHTDENYYRVRRADEGDWSDYEYCLYIEISDTTYYLVGDNLTTTRPRNFDESDDTIWTGVLYTRSTNRTTKMEAMQAACSTFIDDIAAKAMEHDVEHRIAVVKFAGDKRDRVGDETYRESILSGDYNYTQIVSNLSTDFNSLKSAINSFEPGGPTSVDYGMQHAETIINGIPSTRESAKLVVMFTDGAPNHDYDFDSSVANAAIAAAHDLKNNHVKVYAVGTFSSSDASDANINKYMNFVSSNYPDATRMNNGGTQADTKYYMNTTDASELNNIFDTIATEESETGTVSGGEDVFLVKGEVALNDIITPHFILPSDAGASVSVYAVACSSATKVAKEGKSYTHHPAPGVLIDDNGHVWYGSYTWANSHTAVPVGDGEDQVRITTSTDSEGYTTVSVENYDFAANWVGLDEEIHVTGGNETVEQSAVHGQKLVLEITILPNPESEGGHVSTNTSDSGLYLGDEELSGTPIVEMPVPESVYTPKDIIISLTGLKAEDTALFEISRDCDDKKIVVAITGEGTRVIKLPVKIWNPATNDYDDILYTVKELTDWTWKYDSPTTVLTQDLLVDNTFEFSVSENAATAAKAKNDESIRVNIFTQTTE